MIGLAWHKALVQRGNARSYTVYTDAEAIFTQFLLRNARQWQVWLGARGASGAIERDSSA
jgi:hypothetical protein